jgi:c-di-GMP phosphodiesterase
MSIKLNDRGFYMQYRTPIVSLAVVITLMFFYFTRKRLRLRSTKLFTLFFVSSFFNIIAELSTLYTIYHIDATAVWINRLCHQFFIGSLDITIYFLFLYVDAKAHRQRRDSVLVQLVKSIPLFAALIMVVFGKINYYIAADGRYSYGLMAMTVYISAAVYILGVITLLILYRAQFKNRAWLTILTGIFLWGCFALYQLLNPTALISSMALMLMIVFLLLSFENPREFTDFGIPGVMNSYAFELMLSEYIESKREFFLVTFTLSNEKLIKTSLGYKDISGILSTVFRQQRHITGREAFHVKENSISILCRRNGVYKALLDTSTGTLCYRNKNGISVSLDYFTSILAVPQYVQTANEVMSVLDYVSTEGVYRQKDGLLLITDEIVGQMGRNSAVEMLIQNAVEHDGFEVYYQPIYSTEENKFSSAEALVRLKDKTTLGYISPEVFIPIAEKQGLIKKLGMIVFDKVCAFAVGAHLRDYGIDYIEVNISGIQGVDEELPELLKSCMDKYAVSPRFFNLEITETASVNVGEMLLKNMNKLRAIGCGFSMDDFGTGYSNLAKMVQTHFDLIKIDKSLLWPCFQADNKDAVVLLESCIELIQRLGLGVVAEGVETEEQMKMLKRNGVTYMQGYYFARPMPEDAYISFLSEHI